MIIQKQKRCSIGCPKLEESISSNERSTSHEELSSAEFDPTPMLPVPSSDEKGVGLETVRSLRKIQPPATHGIDAIENYTGSVVAPVTKGGEGYWGIQADYEKSAIRTCSLSSASRVRSSTTTADEDRLNDGEDTSQQRSRYP
ncbi:unnamed protein product [Soboliphyme baturini]|uniref:Uncharacterized protein n=1 Tax=Soboliphyme baturini TaxID=241478 RepID=A0A183J550_9BILA|nr:unnamed protein product [Soboliphyme baturini]